MSEEIDTTELDSLVMDYLDAKAGEEKYRDIANEIAVLILEKMNVGDRRLIRGSGVEVLRNRPYLRRIEG